MSARKTIQSYYHYPLRSFGRHKRSYILLACSILCMVILCTSVLIYYASSYEAEIETLRREVGPQHTQFYDVAPDEVSLLTDHKYIKQAHTVEIYASADNPDEYVSMSQVYFTGYSNEAADFFNVRVTEGRLPTAFGEIIVSEKTARYFECFTPDTEQDVTIFVRGKYMPVTFKVVGVFRSSSAAEAYVFCSDETATYLKSEDVYKQNYTVDVYLIFKGVGRTAVKRNMQNLIDDLDLKDVDSEGNETEIYYEARNSMLSEIALVPPYYEGRVMLFMFFFSVLPAGIALTVFIYLDLQKNLGELATLTMIGATWKQIFKMQLLKYSIIFLSVFPFGVAGAAGIMYAVCRITDAVSPDRVFLWYRFDASAVFLLFLIAFGILVGVVFYLSKRMTSIAHAEMLSRAHNASNIFVSRTSNILFSENRILDRISVLFFTRNRGVNTLFCAVVILLVVIYAFFSQQIANEYKAAPDNKTMKLVDFDLYGDAEVSIIYDTMLPDTQDRIEAIPHVSNVQRQMRITNFYSLVDGIAVESKMVKRIVNNNVWNGTFGQMEQGKPRKDGVTDTRLIGSDSDLLHMEVGADVVDGDLAALYENENTVALVVHAWANFEDKYYQAGDTLAMRTSWTEYDEAASREEGDDVYERYYGEWKDYTIGAIIYRPDDDAYEDIVTVYTTPELFVEIAGFEDVYRFTVQCDSDEREVIDSVKEELKKLEFEDRFTITDKHEELRLAQAQAMHGVFYITLMQSFVLIVAVLLLVAMAEFMLEVRAPSMRAMYLIGAQHTQIFRMNIVEFLSASVVSTAAGVVVSALIGMFNHGVLSAVIVIFTVLSLILLMAVNIFVPILVCKSQLKQMLK